MSCISLSTINFCWIH